MNLKSLIFHQIEKKRNEEPKNPIFAKNELVVGSLEEKFISDLTNAFRTKPNKLTGSFNLDTINYPFQNHLTDYINKKKTFLEFSNLATNTLFEVLKTVPQATGGYIVFARYDLNDEDCTLILMLNNVEKYRIEELILKPSIVLETGALDLAVLVNNSRWKNNESFYLTFIKGKKNISRYFRDTFIGCAEYADSRVLSKKLIKAIDNYNNTNNLPSTKRTEIEEKVKSYASECSNQNKPIQLKEISNLVNQENPDSFYSLASGEEHQISSSFYGHDVLKNVSLVSYKSISGEFQIKFHKKLLREGKIFYNAKENSLTIYEIPDALSKQLKIK